MTDWQELERSCYMQVVKRLPLTLVRGEGARLWDDGGREYLDFVGGWATTSLGHCHPTVVQAIRGQAGTLIQVSNHYYTIPQLRLAQLMVEHSCLDRVFLCNSGAEAAEGAVKLARRYGKLHRDGAYEVITAFNSFHGRTLAMVAATGQQKFHEPYTPLPQGFVNVEFNSIEAIQGATSERTCAVMLEPVQGEGGVNVPDQDYLRQVSEWCRKQGLLFLLDEVQTGVGRLGTLWGYQSFGVEPDVMALAKGLGGGIPIGALLAKERASVFAPGDHGSTFGGNPLASAAAHATLGYIIANDIPAQVRRVGAYLLSGLQGLVSRFEFVAGARGLGLLQALQFQEDISDRVVTACIEEGLLVNPVKPNAIRLMPPLIIRERDVDEAIARLQRALAKVKKAAD